MMARTPLLGEWDHPSSSLFLLLFECPMTFARRGSPVLPALHIAALAKPQTRVALTPQIKHRHRQPLLLLIPRRPASPQGRKASRGRSDRPPARAYQVARTPHEPHLVLGLPPRWGDHGGCCFSTEGPDQAGESGDAIFLCLSITPFLHSSTPPLFSRLSPPSPFLHGDG
jgi:hypothetical protein